MCSLNRVYSSGYGYPLYQEEDVGSECTQLEKKYKTNMIITGIVSGLSGFLIGSIIVRLWCSYRKVGDVRKWAGIKSREARDSVKRATASRLKRMAEGLEEGTITPEEINLLWEADRLKRSIEQ